MAEVTVKSMRSKVTGGYTIAVPVTGHVSEAIFVDAASPTPNPVATKGIIIHTAGAVACRMAGAAGDVTLTLPAGFHPLAITHIRASGTTATGITAVF